MRSEMIVSSLVMALTIATMVACSRVPPATQTQERGIAPDGAVGIPLTYPPGKLYSWRTPVGTWCYAWEAVGGASIALSCS